MVGRHVLARRADARVMEGEIAEYHPSAALRGVGLVEEYFTVKFKIKSMANDGQLTSVAHLDLEAGTGLVAGAAAAAGPGRLLFATTTTQGRRFEDELNDGVLFEEEEEVVPCAAFEAYDEARMVEQVGRSYLSRDDVARKGCLRSP